MQTDTSKHTPPPWRVGEGLGIVICDTMDDTTYHSPGELHAYGGALIAESIRHEANARLIAAAPDLLEACKTISALELHRTFTCANGGLPDAECSKCIALAAIAKAEAVS